MAIENEKPKISFMGCGFVGGTWIRYLEKEKKYVDLTLNRLKKFKIIFKNKK